MNWTIIVALKALPAAKSRLAATSPHPQQHAELVHAIRADTLAVAAAAGRVLVVLDRPTLDQPVGERADQLVIVQVGAGLNAALQEGAEHARRTWPDDGVVALVGDLPALRVEELSAALTLAEGNRLSFVADVSGMGTTLLAATPGTTLDPAFGPDSARRHALVATELTAGPGLRLDVDTQNDLDQARELGLGPATRAVLARR